MNDAQLHLLVNHLPIVLPSVGLFLLLGGYLFKSEVVKRAAFAVFIAGAISAFASMATGEGAERVAEHLNGVTHGLIHEHEEHAEKLALVSYLLGLLSIVGLWASLTHKRFVKIITLLVLLISLVAVYIGYNTGHTGGEIIHTEIREGYVAPAGDEHHEDGERQGPEHPEEHNDED